MRSKCRLGGPRGFREQLSQKSLASRIFIVQNGPAWSWVRRPATALNRAEFGQLSRLGGSVEVNLPEAVRLNEAARASASIADRPKQHGEVEHENGLFIATGQVRELLTRVNSFFEPRQLRRALHSIPDVCNSGSSPA